MEKSEIKKYKGNDYVIGLTWKEISGKKAGIVRSKIKETISRHKLDGFGVKIEEDKTNIQIGFSNKKAKGVPSLAKIFASKEKFRNSLIALRISKPEDKEQLFWSVGITEDGFIAAGQDRLYTEDEFIDVIGSELQLSDGETHFYVADDSREVIEELLIESIDNVEIFDFDPDAELAGSGKIKDVQIDLVYNKSVDTVKNGVTFLAVVMTLGLAYQYLYNEDPMYHEITGSDMTNNFSKQFTKLKKEIKKSKKKQEVDVENIEVLAKTEILANRTSIYNNEEIFDGIKMLFDTFPVYLVEWELVDVRYINRSKETFRISYKRIQDSYGYKEEIEQELAKILKAYNLTNYYISYPNPSGDFLYLDINFKNPSDVEKQEVLRGFSKEDLDAEKLVIFDKLEKANKRISGIKNETSSLGFYDKRFGDELMMLRSRLSKELKNSKKEFQAIKDLDEKFSTQEVVFDDSLLGGTRSQTLSMMQQHSYYSWSEGTTPRTYPASNTKKTKKQPSFQPYARSFDFVVGSGSNIDIIGLTGLKNIILSDNLLEKNHIKIKEVSFNLNNEVWEIKGETYEKI
jgi:hypothetical protein